MSVRLFSPKPSELSIRTIAVIALLLVHSTVFIGTGYAADSYDLGKTEGGAVRIAIWIDHYGATCNQDKVPKYWNLTDAVLKACKGGSRSADKVLANASKASGMPVAALRKLATDEVDAKKQELGGCKSTSMKGWVEAAKAALVQHTDELNALCVARAYSR